MNKKISVLLPAVIAALGLCGCEASINDCSDDLGTIESEYIGDLLAKPEFIVLELVGLSWEEVSEKYGSVITITAEQEYSDAEKGRIFEQDPPAGKRVPLKKTITVKVSMGTNN